MILYNKTTKPNLSLSFVSRGRLHAPIQLLDVASHLHHGPFDITTLLLSHLHGRLLSVASDRWTNRYLVWLHGHILIRNPSLTIQNRFVSVLVRPTKLLRYWHGVFKLLWSFVQFHFLGLGWLLRLLLVCLHDEVCEICDLIIVFSVIAPQLYKFIIQINKTYLGAVWLPSPHWVVNLHFRCFELCCLVLDQRQNSGSLFTHTAP
jgi:hypothetical protein